MPSQTIWLASATDDDGGVTSITLQKEDDGRLGVVVAHSDGYSAGLLLDRPDVQSLRHAVTGHLVAGARQVSP